MRFIGFHDILPCSDSSFSLSFAVALGAPMNYSTPPRKDYINLFVKSIEEVDYTNGTLRKDIVDFYRHFQTEHRTWEEIIVHFVDAFAAKEKYLFAYGKYYRIEFEFPYLGICYAPYQLKGEEPVKLGDCKPHRKEATEKLLAVAKYLIDHELRKEREFNETVMLLTKWINQLLEE